MKSGYESLTWLNDKEGREYVCSIKSNDRKTSFELLSKEEQKTCRNVNEIVGTERW
jgi:hypothetical protein